jgi:hypothetical protein
MTDEIRVSYFSALAFLFALLTSGPRAAAQQDSWEEKAPGGTGRASSATSAPKPPADTSAQLSPQRVQQIMDLAGDSASFFVKNKIPFVVRKGGGSFFDPKTRTMVLDLDSSAAQQAQALVFEASRQRIDTRKNDIRVDLGIKAFDEENFRTNGHADPAVRDKFQPKTRDEFVNDKLDTVAQAASDVIEFNKRLSDRGVATSPAPLESVFTEAFNRAFAKQFAETLGETGDSNIADNRAREKATAAARQAVLEAVKSGKLRTGDGRQTFIEVADKEFAQREAERAKKEAELAKARAEAKAKDERKAKRLETIKAFADIVNRTDPNSPQADEVIRLVDSLLPLMSGAEQGIFIDEAEKGLDKLLGPFGFTRVAGTEVGGLQRHRLEFALAVHASLKPAERAEVRRDPIGAAIRLRKGILLGPTPKELEAEGRLVAVRKLPDGTLHVGPLSEFKQAEQQNRINHALEQLEQIRGAGPASLLGRALCGEDCAVIGSGFDLFLTVVAPPTARANQQREIEKTGGGGTGGGPPVVAEVRPPPRRIPAEERPRPEGETVELIKPSGKAPPANASQPKPPKNGNPPAQPSGRQDLGNTGQTGDFNADVQKEKNRQQEQLQRREQTVKRAAEAKAKFDRAVEKLETSGETLTVDRALDGIERNEFGGFTASTNSKRHEQAFRDNGGKGRPPIVFVDKIDGSIRIDVERLDPPQEKRLQTILANRGRSPGGSGSGSGGAQALQQPKRPGESGVADQKTGEITRPGASQPGAGAAAISSGTPGKFGPEDVAFGIAKGKRLVNFAGRAFPGTGAPLRPGTSNLAPGPERDKAIARDTLAFVRDVLKARGGTLRFNLEGFSVKGAITKGSAVFGRITSEELRGVLKDPQLLGRTRFYHPDLGELRATVNGSDFSSVRFLDASGADVTAQVLAEAPGK